MMRSISISLYVCLGLCKRFKFIRALDRAFRTSPRKLLFCISFSNIPLPSKAFLLQLFGSPFREFLVALGLSGIPVSLVAAFVGASAQNLVDVFSGGGTMKPGEIAVLVIGFFFSVLAVGVGVYYSRRARREFDSILDAPTDENPSELFTPRFVDESPPSSSVSDLDEEQQLELVQLSTRS